MLCYFCKPTEPRQKPISFAMSLGYAYAGACALLTRTQCYLTRQQWEKTSLRGAYALGNLEKMIPHHRFCLRHRLFSPSNMINMFAASALWGWRRARGRRRGRRATRMVASATEGQCASNISKTVPTTRFLWRHCRSEKAFVCAGMWATNSKSQVQLTALLTRSLRGTWP